MVYPKGSLANTCGTVAVHSAAWFYNLQCVHGPVSLVVLRNLVLSVSVLHTSFGRPRLIELNCAINPVENPSRIAID